MVGWIAPKYSALLQQVAAGAVTAEEATGRLAAGPLAGVDRPRLRPRRHAPGAAHRRPGSRLRRREDAVADRGDRRGAAGDGTAPGPRWSPALMPETVGGARRRAGPTPWSTAARSWSGRCPLRAARSRCCRRARPTPRRRRGRADGPGLRQPAVVRIDRRRRRGTAPDRSRRARSSPRPTASSSWPAWKARCPAWSAD